MFIWRGCVLAEAVSFHKSGSEQDLNRASYVEAVADDQFVARIVARLWRECVKIMAR